MACKIIEVAFRLQQVRLTDGPFIPQVRVGTRVSTAHYSGFSISAVMRGDHDSASEQVSHGAATPTAPIAPHWTEHNHLVAVIRFVRNRSWRTAEMVAALARRLGCYFATPGVKL